MGGIDTWRLLVHVLAMCSGELFRPEALPGDMTYTWARAGRPKSSQPTTASHPGGSGQEVADVSMLLANKQPVAPIRSDAKGKQPLLQPRGSGGRRLQPPRSVPAGVGLAGVGVQSL